MEPDRNDDVLLKLEALGWQAFFADQVDANELPNTPPVRVMEVHRGGFQVQGETIDLSIPPIGDVTVGDWLLFDAERPVASKVLARKSLIKRRAPGSGRQVQLIAANIETLFIVTSFNQDFSLARLERYVALAFEAGVAPVIVLTKSDLCPDRDTFIAEASSISDRVPVVWLDARGDEPVEKLAPWCRAGQTVAFLGSSGVGKSTLTNALYGAQTIATQDVRQEDSKGRHTTTHRQLHIVPSGCAVLDTPGMRELQLAEAGVGIGEVFIDLIELAGQCRFNDCKHEVEPGCAVRAASEDGSLDVARLARWRKLVAEEAENAAKLAQARSKEKSAKKQNSRKPTRAQMYRDE